MSKQYAIKLKNERLNDTYIGAFIDILVNDEKDLSETGRIKAYDNVKKIVYAVTRCEGRWDMYHDYPAKEYPYSDCEVIIKSRG